MLNVPLHKEDKPHKQFDCDKGIHDWSKWSKKWFASLPAQHRRCQICNLEQVVDICLLETSGFIKNK